MVNKIDFFTLFLTISKMSQYWPLFDKLPREIKEIIEKMVWNMEHKDKFLPLLNELPLKAVHFKLDSLSKEYISEYNSESFITFLKYNLNDKEKLVNVLSKCKCCSRHQKNRPNHIHDWELKFNPKEETKKYSCKCCCRQYSRMICSSILI